MQDAKKTISSRAETAQRRSAAEQAGTSSTRYQDSPRMEAQRQQLYGLFGSAVQRQEVQEEESPAQACIGGAGAASVAQAVGAPSVNATGMPNQLKAGIEALSGMDMSDVRVHRNSDKPAQLSALAYAQGNHIHLGPGQEHHLPHEAWHVVQQTQGRVRPTLQMKDGVAVNDEPHLEHEADVMGAMALRKAGTGSAAGDMAQSSATTMRQQAPMQLRTIKGKGIAGLTHLVALTESGHIYNEDWQANEREEVSYGDHLSVDIDSGLMSRRGMHQELNAERDGTAPQDQLWFEAVALNREQLPADRYVRGEMLFDPPVIQLPRSRDGLDGAIEQLLKLMEQLQPHIVGGSGQADGLLQELRGFATTLQTTIAVEVNLEARGLALEKALKKIEELPLESVEEQLLKERLECTQKVRSEYARYKKPKQQVGGGGKLSRDMLAERGVRGLDLGGIGLEKGMLDVNINDEVNDSNMLLIGDAMQLPAMFEEDCVDTVIAKLLPVVLMEESHTVEARRLVVARVLAGVDHVCKKGTVSINFNDSSDPGRLNEKILLELAEQYGFNLERQNARLTISLSALKGGIGMLGKNKEGSQSSEPKKPPPEKQPPLEPLYRWFTFKR